jgi:hypothetical protein
VVLQPGQGKTLEFQNEVEQEQKTAADHGPEGERPKGKGPFEPVAVGVPAQIPGDPDGVADPIRDQQQFSGIRPVLPAVICAAGGAPHDLVLPDEFGFRYNVLGGDGPFLSFVFVQ